VPIYSYECPNGHKEEFLESYNSPISSRCQNCDGYLVRVMSVPARAVIVKGCTGAQRR
jgi:putative FmdB family regulatory protein